MIWLTLLLATVAVFFVQLGFPNFFLQYFAFTPILALKMPWTFVTSIFLHAGFTHIFFNMLALFSFGPYLERKLGSKNFLVLYFLSGIVGNLLFMLLSLRPEIPAVGASGAIFGILGALAVLEPALVIFVGFVPMPIWMATIFWVILEGLGAFDPANPIGSAAHLGGLFFGMAFALYYKKFLRKKREEEFFFSAHY